MGRKWNTIHLIISLPRSMGSSLMNNETCLRVRDEIIETITMDLMADKYRNR